MAEDNAVNQVVIQHQLSRAGHEVCYLAKDGREVLRALEETEFDAVLMDCQMPELDGYETTREIRRREGARRRLWVVAMTANTMEGDREKCLLAGMDDYVSKPPKEKELLMALERVPAKPCEAAELDADMPRVDAAALMRLRELGGPNGESFLKSLVERFSQSGSELALKLRSALASEDFAGAARAAHTLGGSAGNFGAGALVRACSELEAACGLEQLAPALNAAARVATEFNLVKRVLREACAEKPQESEALLR
ncbi:MAG: hybrid sensor histidine kinase/response regulator [Verrucomicrobia bacterium]|nr:hybrid sensor histidine kinase/response regulator [Verrucomicrobiota bacterium]